MYIKNVAMLRCDEKLFTKYVRLPIQHITSLKPRPEVKEEKGPGFSHLWLQRHYWHLPTDIIKGMHEQLKPGSFSSSSSSGLGVRLTFDHINLHTCRQLFAGSVATLL